MSTAYFYLTGEGKRLAEKLAASHPGDLYGKDNFKHQLQEAFHHYDYLVCIMATGIVVRILAPLIVHKTSDPGVVVLDQKGRHAISLLSGHLGGANDLAREMASLSGGDPVITTATDVAGEISFDSFAKEHHLAIENIQILKRISGALLDGKTVQVITDYHYPQLEKIPAEGKLKLISAQTVIKTMTHNSKPPVLAEAFPNLPTVVIDEGLQLPDFKDVLYLRPRTICAGIGCKRGMDADSIRNALLCVLKKEGLSPLSLKCISTIPLKSNEPGILATADALQVPLSIVPTEQIENLDISHLNIQTSAFVSEKTGVPSVSTASAYISSGEGKILQDKVKFKGITIALCQEITPQSPEEPL